MDRNLATRLWRQATAAIALTIAATSCFGCVKPNTVAEFTIRNGYPLLVASAAELADGTLTLYGARKIGSETKPDSIDVRKFQSKTLLYISNRDEAEKLRLLVLTGVPDISFKNEVLDAVYNMIPPVIVNLKDGEATLVKVSVDGVVGASDSPEIKAIRFLPASAGGAARDSARRKD